MDRPILFNREMVRAILEDRKTMTRRVVKPQPIMMDSGMWYPSENPGDRKNKTGLHYANEKHMRKGMSIDFSPCGQPGDKLWVRETFAYKTRPKTENSSLIYKADFDTKDGFGSEIIDFNTGMTTPLTWEPSIFMPRWASRITLEIINVGIQRIQEIKYFDIMKEGAPLSTYPHHHDSYDTKLFEWFTGIWDSVNAKRGFGWDANPWVWIIEFKRVRVETEVEQ